jgi:hypothetical protein
MGFFRKIGKGIKKATKQISIKNAIKLAGNAVSTLPGVGGVVGSAILNAQDAREAKKQQQQANYETAMTKFQDNTQEVGKTLASQGVQSLWNGANEGFKDGTQKVGANIIQGSLMQWFKKYWYIPVSIIVTLYFVMKKNNSRSPIRRRY